MNKEITIPIPAFLHWLFRHNCTKIDYKSLARAEKSAQNMNKKPTTRHQLEAYKCKYCGGWHIGNKGDK